MVLMKNSYLYLKGNTVTVAAEAMFQWQHSDTDQKKAPTEAATSYVGD